ncbi:MAG: alpha/beta hydrolase [Anaerolineae bacterium]|nr:alpha/beta hydrolase [Anaerolineae bacterium]
MPDVVIRGRRVYYERCGAGPAVVLLHHATASSRSWRRQVPVLAERFQVIAYDRPGFGRSEPVERWALDYLTDDVADLVALLDALAVAEASLVGHSDGAAIALMAAARHPSRVRCVVAEAPHVFVDTATCPPAVARYYAMATQSPSLLAALERDHGENGLQVLRRWRDRWTDPAFWTWDVSGELERVGCPVLVVHGVEDEFFPVAHAELVAARLVHSELWLLPGVGHMPHGERPEEFTERALAFLLQHTAPSSS